MNTDPSCAPTSSAARRALALAGGTLLLAASCTTAPTYGPEGNVFVQPRYGYGSPNQPSTTTERAASTADRADAAGDRASNRPLNKPTTNRKIQNIKRDPSDTTVDVSPPEVKENKESSSEDTSSDTPPPSSEPKEKEKTTEAPEEKPAAPREDLQYGQPVVGKKGFVYSPFAPDKGQVDVEGIPAGTKVKCPYTGKTFRVP